MSKLTPERLAELREMHKKATPYHQTAKSEDNLKFLAALRNSASALFDLAQEALERREAEKPPVRIDGTLAEAIRPHTNPTYIDRAGDL